MSDLIKSYYDRNESMRARRENFCYKIHGFLKTYEVLWNVKDECLELFPESSNDPNDSLLQFPDIPNTENEDYMQIIVYVFEAGITEGRKKGIETTKEKIRNKIESIL